MQTNLRRSLWFHIFDVTLNIVIIVAIVAIIRTFIVSPFQIEGNSMIDTLENKEYIVINKFRSSRRRRAGTSSCLSRQRIPESTT